MDALSKAAKNLLQNGKCANLRLGAQSEYNATTGRHLSQMTYQHPKIKIIIRHNQPFNFPCRNRRFCCVFFIDLFILFTCASFSETANILHHFLFHDPRFFSNSNQHSKITPADAKLQMNSIVLKLQLSALTVMRICHVHTVHIFLFL